MYLARSYSLVTKFASALVCVPPQPATLKSVAVSAENFLIIVLRKVGCVLRIKRTISFHRVNNRRHTHPHELPLWLLLESQMKKLYTAAEMFGFDLHQISSVVVGGGEEGGCSLGFKAANALKRMAEEDGLEGESAKLERLGY